jgi:hypothetical protein
MQALVHYCRSIITGLLWFIETGWDIWANLFSALPYGDPYLAAVAMGMLFVIADRIVRPRR